MQVHMPRCHSSLFKLPYKTFCERLHNHAILWHCQWKIVSQSKLACLRQVGCESRIRLDSTKAEWWSFDHQMKDVDGKVSYEARGTQQGEVTPRLML